MNTLRAILSPILFPISLLYSLVIYVRNRLYDIELLKSKQFHIPIISIGNITAGGTGKTPHIEYLVKLLKDDFNIATLSRGYKRKTDGFLLSTTGSTDLEIGDEPRQIKQKYPQIKVAVDADRTNGIKQLQKLDSPLDVILLDDAFQHRKVKPGVSILLIDFSRPIHKDFMLPLGNLRDNKTEKKRADIIIVTKCPRSLPSKDQEQFLKKIKPRPNQKVFFTSFRYGKLKAVFDEKENKQEQDITDVLLLTGIANPKPLKQFILNTICQNIRSVEYPDHYNFKESDFKNIQKTFNAIKSDSKIIITTEKDAMRLQKFSNIAGKLKKQLFYIPIQVEFLNQQSEVFNKQIIEYVRKD